MNSHLINFLNTRLGYDVNQTPYMVIRTCDSWYQNEVVDGFHERKTVQGVPYTLERTNMAKRCCEDDANLCEIIDINASGSDSEEAYDNEQNKFINNVLADNRFDVVIREQIERISASGTAGAYVILTGGEEYTDGSIRGGKIKINYVKADQIAPLTIVNNEVIECAFAGVNIIDNKKRYILVIFTCEDGVYSYSTYIFDSKYKLVNKEIDVELGTVKPFAVLRTAGVNNVSGMKGFGVPKIWNAEPFLKMCDLGWNVFQNDLEKADKLVFINEAICKFDSNGKPITPSDEAKKLLVMLGEKLPDQQNLIHEYTPQLRVDDIESAMKLSLSMLSNSFGFGTKKYSFENGQITTATEYIGERQDSMQALNKQRYNITAYITDLIRAIVWFGNKYQGTSFDEELTPLIDYDDSFVNDKQAKLENMRNDASLLQLPMLIIKYLMKAYNLTEEEAREWADGGVEDVNE